MTVSRLGFRSKLQSKTVGELKNPDVTDHHQLSNDAQLVLLLLLIWFPYFTLCGGGGGGACVYNSVT